MLSSDGKPRELSFTVQTIECVACTPVFRRVLGRINGILEVKEFPITNKIVVTFDGSLLDGKKLEHEIIGISKKAGFGDRVIFRH